VTAADGTYPARSDETVGDMLGDQPGNRTARSCLGLSTSGTSALPSRR